MSRINHLEDGISHINTWSKGKTELGRMLSNFYHSPFYHSEIGAFSSMEGYWYYVKSGMKYEELKLLSGFDAKKLGKTFKPVNNPHFKRYIREGIYCKIYQNEDIKQQLVESVLPFEHYYVYNEVDVVTTSSAKLLNDTLEEIRRDLKFDDF